MTSDRRATDRRPGAPEGPAVPVAFLPSEKLMCEREARHDVAARGRRIDPAAALHRYISHTRIEEERCHREHPDRSSARRGGNRDPFVAQHPLASSLLRWGEDRR